MLTSVELHSSHRADEVVVDGQQFVERTFSSHSHHVFAAQLYDRLDDAVARAHLFAHGSVELLLDSCLMSLPVGTGEDEYATQQHQNEQGHQTAHATSAALFLFFVLLIHLLGLERGFGTSVVAIGIIFRWLTADNTAIDNGSQFCHLPGRCPVLHRVAPHQCLRADALVVQLADLKGANLSAILNVVILHFLSLVK